MFMHMVAFFGKIGTSGSRLANFCISCSRITDMDLAAISILIIRYRDGVDHQEYENNS